MLGAIIGDIVGSSYEFNPTNDYNFELFAEGSNFTDDTVCTIAVADALLNGRDFGTAIHQWCRKYPNPKGGYGGRFHRWVMSDNPLPYGSYGNGSAMRVSPIGWWCDSHDLIPEAKRSAECTHNHPDAVEGAEAVAIAISDCLEMRRLSKGRKLTRDTILWNGLSHAVGLYAEFPQNFRIDLEECRNKFDLTCRGTVMTALWIVLNSTGFEDALRRAVSLGGDADTLGAVAGSIAEAIWGIPEWMKAKALSYLPAEMAAVVTAFHRHLNRLRRLTRRCEYYKIGEFSYSGNEHQLARKIEKEWAHDLAKTYSNADKVKAEMAGLCAMEQWQAWADQYDLPVSLIGYIFKQTADHGTYMHERVGSFEKFLREEYSGRAAAAQKKKAEKEKMEQLQTIMLWKLGLGNMAKLFNGEDAMPPKVQPANKDSWHTEPWPENNNDLSICKVDIKLPWQAMETLRKGHIPEAQEDHWFMYVDNQYIRYYRSWTGMPAFEARYHGNAMGFIIDTVKFNKALSEFGVNSDAAGVALFKYLVTAEVGGDAGKAWRAYIAAWNKK